MARSTVIEKGARGFSGAGISTAQYAALARLLDGFADAVAQTSSDTASTSSTTTWADAMVVTLSLPAGTYEIAAVGWLRLRNDASSNGDMRIAINGTPQTVVTASFGPTNIAKGTVTSAGKKTGVTSTAPTIRVQFKTGDGASGTTFPSNPALFYAVRRTG